MSDHSNFPFKGWEKTAKKASWLQANHIYQLNSNIAKKYVVPGYQHFQTAKNGNIFRINKKSQLMRKIDKKQ